MENVMKVIATALMLVTSAGLAAAQSRIPGTVERPPESLSAATRDPISQIQLTAAQKTAIFDAVRQDGKQVDGGNRICRSIGAPVPPQLELYVLPDRALRRCRRPRP